MRFPHFSVKVVRHRNQLGPTASFYGSFPITAISVEDVNCRLDSDTNRDREKSLKRLPVKVKRLSPDAKLPSYAHPAAEGEMGPDLYALQDELVAPGQIKLISTGLCFSYRLNTEPWWKTDLDWRLRAFVPWLD